MIWLIVASLVWAFSFGLIKGLITGLDPFVMGSLRMAFALIAAVLVASLFGFWRRHEWGVMHPRRSRLALAGFLQLGMMYAPYLASFRYLKAHEVALFTMTTPLFVVAVHQAIDRVFSGRTALAAIVALVGGVTVAYKGMQSEQKDLLLGIVLVQVSNFLFAVGQYAYGKATALSLREQVRSSPFYFAGALGGSLLALCIAATMGIQLRPLTRDEWLIMIWLGAVASGLGFFLWNFGVSRVAYGRLAVATDFKLPLAVVVSIGVFREHAEVVPLLCGGVILIGATWIARVTPQSATFQRSAT